MSVIVDSKTGSRRVVDDVVDVRKLAGPSGLAKGGNFVARCPHCLREHRVDTSDNTDASSSPTAGAGSTAIPGSDESLPRPSVEKRAGYAEALRTALSKPRVW